MEIFGVSSFMFEYVSAKLPALIPYQEFWLHVRTFCYAAPRLDRYRTDTRQYHA